MKPTESDDSLQLGGGKGRVTRRTVLAGIGTGAATASGIRTTVPPVRGTDSTDLEGVRLVPVVGSCQDIFTFGENCGILDADGDRHPNRTGWHDFQITIDGRSATTFLTPDDMGDQSNSSYSIRRENYDEASFDHDLVAHDFRFSFEARHDMAVLDWRSTCSVSPECRATWCDTFTWTVKRLRENASDVDTAVTDANLRWHNNARDVRLQIPGDMSDSEAEAQLEEKVRNAIEAELVRIEADYQANRVQRQLDRTHRWSQEVIAGIDQGEGAIVTLVEDELCSACEDCDEHGAIPYGDLDYSSVRQWDLLFDWDYEGSGGDPISGTETQHVTGRIALASYGKPWHRKGGGLLSAIISFLMGLFQLLLSLFGQKDNSKYLRWHAEKVEFHADYEKMVNWTNGTTTRWYGSGSHETEEFIVPDLNGVFEIDTDTGEYALDWGVQMRIPGTKVHAGTSEHEEILMETGAQALENGERVQAIQSEPLPPEYRTHDGVVNWVNRRFSLPDSGECGEMLHDTVENTLRYKNPSRWGMTTYRSGSAVGHERLTFRLVPTKYGNSRDSKRVEC